MTLSFDFTIIREKADLLKHWPAVSALFRQCYAKQLSEDLWSWAYLHNPLDAPFVALCHDSDGRLIGHVGAIPIGLANQREQRLRALLFMTVMVHPDVRKYGIFQEMGKLIYTHGQQLGYDLVCGFPNKFSRPGFKKRLNWRIADQGRIVTATGRQIAQCPALLDYLNTRELFAFDCAQAGLMQWRLRKPGQNYRVRAGFISKEYHGREDIMQCAGHFETLLDPEAVYNILVDAGFGLAGIETTEYCFGYHVLNSALPDVEIKKELILSDIF
jgi:predicted N-acetyltransferase YhbS